MSRLWPSSLLVFFALVFFAATPAATTTIEPLPAERIIPLGRAEVSELFGGAWACAKTTRRPLQKGEWVQSGQRIELDASTDSRVELRFADGSLLRLGNGASVTLLEETRQVALHRGRLLVVGDRMLGSIAVLTRRMQFLPEGTTYIVELETPPAEPQLRLTVLEGAVCACANPPAGKSVTPTQDMIILPGERLEIKSVPGPLRPQPESLTAQLKDEPLVARFSHRLPSFLRIDDLADQQRRHFLLGRNERLRREIFWKRPPRKPIQLPPLFSDPDPPFVRYEYPR